MVHTKCLENQFTGSRELLVVLQYMAMVAILVMHVTKMPRTNYR